MSKAKKEIRFLCNDVRMVDTAKVAANDYNPNKVARTEMDLLRLSIIESGFCYPLVTIHDPDSDRYIIVDGFHRYSILQEMDCDQVPVVVLDAGPNEYRSATVRFNRARGVHQVDLMGDLVASMIREGWDDTRIATELGMESEEVLRLRQQVGAAQVLSYGEYGKAWEVR